MKIMILCDMDGTLTPARCKIEKDMIETLNRVLDKGYEIGVVSGSGLDYMNEQLSDWDRWSSGNSRIKKYPVNGTNDLDMKSYCGEENWNEVLNIVLSTDSIMRCEWEGGLDIRLPANIIQERGSAINWCPIGRDADMVEREKWVQLDKEYNFRNRCLEIVKSYRLFQHDFTIKLGGETSFDIYPKGWDKSYVFRYYEDYDRVYFIGDRCEEWGNDYEGYVRAGEWGRKTSGPRETIEILKKISE